MNHYSYLAFANRLISENRYFHDNDVQEFLDFIASYFPERLLTLSKDTQLWRAQLGCDTETELQNGEEYGEVSVPWKPARMIPDPSKVREGRANPRGISYLYLSTSKETAMHEVRPWTGSVLSTAVFKIHKDLRLVDFSRFYGKAQQTRSVFSSLQEATEEQIMQTVWTNIDNAFSAPVPNNEEPTRYIPTQVIAELVKSKGYDGIAYRSVFSDGFNIVLFDLKVASLIYCSIFHAITVEMGFLREEGICSEYWIDKE
jgi:hypothetical protein